MKVLILDKHNYNFRALNNYILIYIFHYERLAKENYNEKKIFFLKLLHYF